MAWIVRMPLRFSWVKLVSVARASCRSRKKGNIPRAIMNPITATNGSGNTTQKVNAGDMTSMNQSAAITEKTNMTMFTAPKDTTMRTMLMSFTARDIRSPVPNLLKKLGPWYWTTLKNRFLRS